MASSSPFNKVVVVWAVLTVLLISRSSAYPSSEPPTCSNVYDIVRGIMTNEINQDNRTGASILRLHFHDCFVNGCDGSILLDDTDTFTGEKNAAPNRNSVRRFDVIDKIKSAVEQKCPGQVSCADILAIAARDAVSILSGGNCNYDVIPGRKDSLSASQAAANTSIPTPTLNITALIKNFASHNLTKQDLVALSGAHTIGLARCTNFKSVIYNETNTLDKVFAQDLQRNCPSASGWRDNNTAPLDKKTPFGFDNSYYRGILSGTFLLHSDRQLLNDQETANLVQIYSKDLDRFYLDFGVAMQKMGALGWQNGGGEIRKFCRKTNN